MKNSSPDNTYKTAEINPHKETGHLIRPDQKIKSESLEYDQDIFRLDASDLKQTFVDGRLQVTFPLQIRSATRLEQKLGEARVQYGIPDELKRFVKIVSVNQNMQTESLQDPPYRALQNGPNRMTPMGHMGLNCRTIVRD